MSLCRGTPLRGARRLGWLLGFRFWHRSYWRSLAGLSVCCFFSPAIRSPLCDVTDLDTGGHSSPLCSHTHYLLVFCQTSPVCRVCGLKGRCGRRRHAKRGAQAQVPRAHHVSGIERKAAGDTVNDCLPQRSSSSGFGTCGLQWGRRGEQHARESRMEPRPGGYAALCCAGPALVAKCLDTKTHYCTSSSHTPHCQARRSRSSNS